ncbi:hypothetical protein PPS11_00817 [Pseudomonas putida S11]|nr:hypothetical protein PPS11_00817 [Pseudomonas putida S11]
MRWCQRRLARAQTRGTGGQLAAQPGEPDFADLHPAAAAGRLAALLEGQAFAVGIEAGIGVVARALEQQGPERGHGGESCALGLGARIRARR